MSSRTQRRRAVSTTTQRAKVVKANEELHRMLMLTVHACVPVVDAAGKKKRQDKKRVAKAAKLLRAVIVADMTPEARDQLRADEAAEKPRRWYQAIWSKLVA